MTRSSRSKIKKLFASSATKKQHESRKNEKKKQRQQQQRGRRVQRLYDLTIALFPRHGGEKDSVAR